MYKTGVKKPTKTGCGIYESSKGPTTRLQECAVTIEWTEGIDEASE